ncbi:MAG: porin [Prevotella denticola]|uniref:porin n=1 Tax=Prevotella denticola TaxID=28129 RepID=UPI003FA14025
MKKNLLCACLLALSLGAEAQDNHGYGADDGQFKSLAEEVAGLKKHNDMFNVYINYAASVQAKSDADHRWGTAFANRLLRLEIKGNLTDRLYYRLRHRLDKSNEAKGEDNFAKATDIMMIGYRFSDKFKLEGGKLCQTWGGFEYDENPLHIYEFSELAGALDIYMAGVIATCRPVPSQELALGVTNSHNEKFNEVYGDNPMAVEADGTHTRSLEKSHNPLTYIVNWNGGFLHDRLQTRWSWGLQGEARHKYSRMVFLGQKLNLDRLQWYFDYMGEFDGLDRLGIATGDVSPSVTGFSGRVWLSDVHYNSFVTKLNWQFAPQWNLMLKGASEQVSVRKTERLKNFRKSYSYIGSVEYYPVKSQDLRFFLAYIGRKVTYREGVGLDRYNTNRIELGFMYRIKAY